MSFTGFVKALFLPVVAGAAFAAPLLGATPASAVAGCLADPLNGVCVSTTSYTVKTTVSKVAVQRTPKTGNLLRSIAGGSTVTVICQVSNGGTADGYTSQTW